jgi:hypothetical protein
MKGGEGGHDDDDPDEANICLKRRGQWRKLRDGKRRNLYYFAVLTAAWPAGIQNLLLKT